MKRAAFMKPTTPGSTMKKGSPISEVGRETYRQGVFELKKETPDQYPLGGRRWTFFTGLFLLCASTLMYEVVLTRLLSVVCWYYLAFVSVSMAMFGMTVGALAVQL